MWKVILVLLFSPLVLASEKDLQAIKSIERTHEALKSPGQPDCNTCGTTHAGKGDPDWRQCLKAVCPVGYGTYYEQRKKAASIPLNSLEEKKMVELIKNSFRAEIESQVKSYQRMIEFIESGKNLTDPHALQFANLGAAIGHLDKFVLVEGKIDETASRKNLVNLSDPQYQTARAIIALAIDHQQNAKSEFLNEDYDFYVKRHSATTIQTHINEVLDIIKNAYPIIENSWGIPAELMFNLFESGKAERLRRGDFDRFSLEDLRTKFEGVNFFLNISKNPQVVRHLKSNHIEAESILGKNPQGILSTRIDYMKHFLDGKELNPQLGLAFNQEEILGTCLNNLRTAKQFYPSPKQKSEFKAKIETYQKEFVAALGPKLSKSSLITFNKEMAGTKFSLPQTYEEYRTELMLRIKDNLAATQKGIRDGEMFHKTKPEITVAVDMMNRAKFRDDPEYASDLREICEENVPQPIRDKASIGADRVTVGALSVQDEHFGNGTCKHELGHITTGLFENKKLSPRSTLWHDQVKNCLKESKGHDRNIEEDWADLVSAASGGKYDGCAYTEDVESEFTLKNSENAAHSSNLYRNLHNLIVRNGNIPKICEQALAGKGEHFTLKSCFNPK